MADYIPTSDVNFNVWQTSLLQIIEENLVNWGILQSDFDVLKAYQTIWSPTFEKASNKQNRTSADVQAKNDSRDEYETGIRSFVAQWLTNNNKVADSDRERMGLNVRTGSHTPVAVPTTIPTGNIDFSIRLQHTIHFSDEATSRSKAKPEGVHGCEIWHKIGGDAPKSNSEMIYLTTSTRTPYTTTFDGTDAGKTVYYWLRWVNTRGKQGPWSTTLSAMIVG